MAKKWWNENQKKQAEVGEVKAAPAPVSSEPVVNDAFPGVPSRETQAAESERVAGTAPPKTEAEKNNVTAASGDAAARVAPSAPGGTITTKDGTFTAAEWEERQRPAREVSE